MTVFLYFYSNGEVGVCYPCGMRYELVTLVFLAKSVLIMHSLRACSSRPNNVIDCKGERKHAFLLATFGNHDGKNYS